MNKLYRTATLEDGFKALTNLRQEDKSEVEGFGLPLLSVPFGLLYSEHATSFWTPDGDIAGIAGVVRQDERVGNVWMLCTPEVVKLPHTFVRNSRKWIKEVEQDYDLLWNYADSRNTLHHKLLKHLGFKALNQVNIGPYNLPYFEICRLTKQL